MKTSELTGPALDWAVAKCEGIELENGCYNRLLVDGRMSKGQEMLVRFNPSTDWSQGGPIIEREGISIVLDWDVVGEFSWGATRIEGPAVSSEQGPTPLIAAMRCYVASKLGDEVEIPDGLV